MTKKSKNVKPVKIVLETESEPAPIDDDMAIRHVPRRHRRVVQIITDVFFVLCLVILIAAAVVSTQAKQSGQAVEVFGWRPYLIATGSMKPTFEVNGLVVTHRDAFNNVEIGDVISFSAAGLNGQPALHRVIAITCADKIQTMETCPDSDRQLWTKGDNNPHPEGSPVTKDNYLGKVKFNTNLTAWWVGQMQMPYGWLRAAVLPIIMLILFYFGARWLISAPITWRGKLAAFCAVVFLFSAAILASYTLYIVKQVNQTNSDLSKIVDNYDNSEASKTWKVYNVEIIGTIEIPPLGVKYPIVQYNNSATTLSMAIAQFAGPPLNTTGNAVLIGHRAFGDLSPFNLFFTQIDKLKQGDEIFITDPTRERVKYVVQSYGEVSMDDKSILNPTSDGREITLVSASYDLQNRYIVRATAE